MNERRCAYAIDCSQDYCAALDNALTARQSFIATDDPEIAAHVVFYILEQARSRQCQEIEKITNVCNGLRIQAGMKPIKPPSPHPK